MIFFKKKFIKAPIAILVCLSLLLQFSPSLKEARALSADDILKKIYSFIKVPNELEFTEEGGLRFGTNPNYLSSIDCLFKKVTSRVWDDEQGRYEDRIDLEFCNCKLDGFSLKCGWRNRGDCRAECSPAPNCGGPSNPCCLAPGEECVNPFSTFRFGHHMSQATITTESGLPLMPEIRIPQECELKIPLPEDDAAMGPEEKLAHRNACNYFIRLQRAVAQQVHLAKKIFNNTDPLSTCFFLRNCRTSCSFRFGEVKYTITLIDIAKLFLPAGFLTYVEKIVKLIMIFQHLGQMAGTIKEIFTLGVKTINDLFSIANNISTLYYAFENLGFSLLDAALLNPISILMGRTQERVEQGYNGFVKLIDNFSNNLLEYSEAKGEALRVADQAKDEIAAIAEGQNSLCVAATGSFCPETFIPYFDENDNLICCKNIIGFKNEPEIGFLFVKGKGAGFPSGLNYARKLELDRIIADFQDIFFSIRGLIERMSLVGEVFVGESVADRIPRKVCEAECSLLGTGNSACSEVCYNCKIEKGVSEGFIKEGYEGSCVGTIHDQEPMGYWTQDQKQALQEEALYPLDTYCLGISNRLCVLFENRVIPRSAIFSYEKGEELLTVEHIRGMIDRALAEDEGDRNRLDYPKGAWRVYWEQLGWIVDPSEMEHIFSAYDRMETRHKAVLSLCIAKAPFLTIIADLDETKYGETYLRGSDIEAALNDYHQGSLGEAEGGEFWFNRMKLIFEDVSKFQQWFALISPEYIEEVIASALERYPNTDLGKDVYSMDMLDYSKGPWREYWEDVGRAVLAPGWVEAIIKDHKDPYTNEEYKYMIDRHGIIIQKCIEKLPALREVALFDHHIRELYGLYPYAYKTSMPPDKVHEKLEEYRQVLESEEINIARSDVIAKAETIKQNIDVLSQEKEYMNTLYINQPNQYWQVAAWCAQNPGIGCEVKDKQAFFNLSYRNDLIDIDDWDERIDILANSKDDLDIIKNALYFKLSPETPVIVYVMEKAKRDLEELDAAPIVNEVIDDIIANLDCGLGGPVEFDPADCNGGDFDACRDLCYDRDEPCGEQEEDCDDECSSDLDDVDDCFDACEELDDQCAERMCKAYCARLCDDSFCLETSCKTACGLGSNVCEELCDIDCQHDCGFADIDDCLGGSLEACEDSCDDNDEDCDWDYEACKDECSAPEDIYDCHYACDTFRTGTCARAECEYECAQNCDRDSCSRSGCEDACRKGRDECLLGCEEMCSINCRGSSDCEDWINQLEQLKAKLVDILSETSAFAQDLEDSFNALKDIFKELKRLWENREENVGSTSQLAEQLVAKIIKTIELAQEIVAENGPLSEVEDVFTELEGIVEDLEEAVDDTSLPEEVKQELKDRIVESIKLMLAPIKEELIKKIRNEVGYYEPVCLEEGETCAGGEEACPEKDGFLNQIACLEDEIERTFKQINDYFLPVARLLDEAEHKVKEIKEAVVELKPQIRMEVLQMNPEYIEDAFDKGFLGKFKFWETKQEGGKEKLFLGGAAIENIADFRDAVSQNPILFLRGAFEAAATKLYELGFEGRDKFAQEEDSVKDEVIGQRNILSQAHNKIGSLNVYAADNKLNNRQRHDAYRGALGNLQQTSVRDLKTFIFGEGTIEQGCQALHLILEGDPVAMKQSCAERDTSLLNDSALSQKCNDLAQVDLGALEEARQNQDKAQEIAALQAQRECISTVSCDDGRTFCIECPEWICEGVNDPYCLSHADRKKGIAVWAPGTPESEKAWPPRDPCLQGQDGYEESFASGYFGMTTKCKQTQAQLQILTGAQGSGFDWITEELIDLCNQQEIQRSIDRECEQFDMLDRALGNDCWWLPNCTEAQTDSYKSGGRPEPCEQYCKYVRENIKKSFCSGNPLSCPLSIVPNLTDIEGSENKQEDLDTIREMCRAQKTSIKAPLDEVMQVYSILIGIRAGTKLYQGIQSFRQGSDQLIKKVSDFIRDIRGDGTDAHPGILKEMDDIWNKELEEFQGKSGLPVTPLSCESHPGVSYPLGSQGPKSTGPQGGVVCPGVQELFAQLEAEFNLVRNNLFMIDLARRNVAKKGISIGPLKLDVEIYPVKYESIDDLYNLAWHLKQKAQFLWALAVAVDFASQQCTCGQSYCKMPLCISGLPLVFDPISNPYCYVTYIFRYPMEQMAKSLWEDLEHYFKD